jgi:hypothetical protein
VVKTSSSGRSAARSPSRGRSRQDPWGDSDRNTNNTSREKQPARASSGDQTAGLSLFPIWA